MLHLPSVLALGILLQARSSLDDERVRLDIPLPRACQRAIAYAKSGDTTRAVRALKLLDDYASSYDCKWGTRLADSLKVDAAKVDRAALLQIGLTIAYADFVDQISTIASGSQLTPRIARRLLSAAAADYEVMEQLVQASAEGRRFDATIRNLQLSMASLIPRAGHETPGPEWRGRFQALAKALAQDVDAAVPALVSAYASGRKPRPGGEQESTPPGKEPPAPAGQGEDPIRREDAVSPSQQSR